MVDCTCSISTAHSQCTAPVACTPALSALPCPLQTKKQTKQKQPANSNNHTALKSAQDGWGGVSKTSRVTAQSPYKYMHAHARTHRRTDFVNGRKRRGFRDARLLDMQLSSGYEWKQRENLHARPMPAPARPMPAPARPGKCRGW